MQGLRRVPRGAWAALLVALLVRVLVVAETSLPPIARGQDPSDYDRHARSIARGDGYPDSNIAEHGGSALRAPLYPYFLGAVYKATGGGVRAARYAQAFVGTITVALIGVLAWQLAGALVGLVALWTAALYPPLIAFGTAILSEVTFVPVVLAALAAALQYRRSSHDLRWAAATGALGGLACLARPNGFLILIPLLVALWPQRPRFSPVRLRPLAVMLGVVVLTVAPWTVRNSIVFERFTPLGTEGGYVLAGMYNDTVRTSDREKAVWQPPQLLPEYASLFERPDLDEADLDERLRSRALREIREHPGFVLEAGFLNAGRLAHWSGPSRARTEARQILGIPRSVTDAGVYGFYVIAALALVGCATSAIRRVPRFVWLVPLMMATTAFVGGWIRYRAPIDPFLVILAAAAIAAALTKLSTRFASREEREPAGVHA